MPPVATHHTGSATQDICPAPSHSQCDARCPGMDDLYVYPRPPTAVSPTLAVLLSLSLLCCLPGSPLCCHQAAILSTSSILTVLASLSLFCHLLGSPLLSPRQPWHALINSTVNTCPPRFILLSVAHPCPLAILLPHCHECACTLHTHHTTGIPWIGESLSVMKHIFKN